METRRRCPVALLPDVPPAHHPCQRAGSPHLLHCLAITRSSRSALSANSMFPPKRKSASIDKRQMDSQNIHALQTGDLLLFEYHNKTGFLGWLSWMIRVFTRSPYSHIAMVLRDPSFVDPPLQGVYVWESSFEHEPDPQDGIPNKFGVQITPLQRILDEYEPHGSVFVRRILSAASCFSREKLRAIHQMVYRKPYDIVPRDWLEAAFHKDADPQKTSRFWCSALVGYIYTRCGLLKGSTDWSILRPADFSALSQHLTFNPPYALADHDEPFPNPAKPNTPPRLPTRKTET
jgi:hypothetical protein